MKIEELPFNDKEFQIQLCYLKKWLRDQSLMFKAWNNEHAQNIAPGLSCKKILRSKWDNSYLKKECQPTIIGVFTASGDFLPMLTYFILLICLESHYSFIRNFVKCSFIHPRFFSFFPCAFRNWPIEWNFFIIHWKQKINTLTSWAGKMFIQKP